MDALPKGADRQDPEEGAAGLTRFLALEDDRVTIR